MTAFVADDELVAVASALEAVLHRLQRFDEPARLYGLLPPGPWPTGPIVETGDRTWVRLAEGDPYEFLDDVRVGTDEVDALALVACGWARSTTGVAGPRRRVRTVAVVTPYGDQCSVLRFEADGERVVDLHGEGPLLRALATVWATVPPAA